MNPLQWLIPWEPSVVVSVATAITVFAYLRGCRCISCPLWQKLFFYTGVLFIYAVSHTEFDYYAEHEFFVHRFQHAVLHHMGPMLIILSRPGAILRTGFPIWAQGYASTISRWVPVRTAWRTLINPVVVTFSFAGLIMLWLIPPLHFIGMIDWRFYRLMNWGMLINGLMFWGVALGPFSANALSAGGRIGMMLAIIPPQIVAGAVIFYAGHDLYPVYTICGRAFGIDAMTDQQIGGLILWIHGSMMSVIGILIVAWRQLDVRMKTVRPLLS